MNTQILLDRLEKVSKRGAGKWMACCPAHGDRSPSLVITEVEDRILIHCFAGCGAAAVMEAVDLSVSDLFENRIRDHMYGGTPEYRKQQIHKERQRESDELLLKLCEKSRKSGKRLPESDLKAERAAYLRLYGRQ